VLGAGRVQLKTDVRNTRSQQAIARLGARYEGTLRRYQRRADGSVRDTVLFSVVTEDWPTVRAALEHRLTAAPRAAAVPLTDRLLPGHFDVVPATSNEPKSVPAGTSPSGSQEQAERVAHRIEHDPDVVLGLV